MDCIDGDAAAHSVKPRSPPGSSGEDSSVTSVPLCGAHGAEAAARADQETPGIRRPQPLPSARYDHTHARTLTLFAACILAARCSLALAIVHSQQALFDDAPRPCRYYLGGIGTPMSAAPVAGPRFIAGIGTPLSPAAAAVASPQTFRQATPSSHESSNSRLSDGAWCVNPAFSEATTEQVAAQLAFDTPMLTARGGAPLGATLCFPSAHRPAILMRTCVVGVLLSAVSWSSMSAYAQVLLCQPCGRTAQHAHP